MINFHAAPAGTGSGLSGADPASRATAVSLARSVAGTDNVTIWLAGGVYWPEPPYTTQEVTSLDSGGNGFVTIWRANPGELPLFSGGIRVTGWVLHDAAKNIWRAGVPAGSRFRQLHVGGVKATRSRRTSTFYDVWLDPENERGGWVDYDGYDWPGIARPQDLEVWFTHARWSVGMCKCSGGINLGGGETVLLAYADQTGPDTWGREIAEMYPNPTHVENAYEFLSAATKGHWYLNHDTATLYYVPRDGEDMATVEVIAPMLERILDVKDDARDMFFVGIDFAYADWFAGNTAWNLIDAQDHRFHDPSSYDPVLDYPSIVHVIEGCVRVSRASNVKFVQCRARDVDGMGFNIQEGADSCELLACLTQDTGGAGVRVREESYWFLYEPTEGCVPNGSWRIFIQDEADRNKHCKVRSCKIMRACQRWKGGAGISVGAAENTMVLHNELADLPYTAIAITNNFGAWYFPFDIHIAKNLIHDICLEKYDGSALYNQGATYGLTYEENVMYNIGTAAPINPPSFNHTGIYLDDYSIGVTARKNIVLKNQAGGPKDWTLTKNYASQTHTAWPWYNDPVDLQLVHPNRLIDNFFQQGMTQRLEGSNPAFVNTGNVWIPADPAQWPDEAKRIYAEAGPELLLATEIIDGEAIVFGWLGEGETVALTTSAGEVTGYEEPMPGMWRAAITGIEDGGAFVVAATASETSSVIIGYLPPAGGAGIIFDRAGATPVNIWDRTGSSLIHIAKAPYA